MTEAAPTMPLALRHRHLGVMAFALGVGAVLGGGGLASATENDGGFELAAPAGTVEVWVDVEFPTSAAKVTGTLTGPEGATELPFAPTPSGWTAISGTASGEHALDLDVAEAFDAVVAITFVDASGAITDEWSSAVTLAPSTDQPTPPVSSPTPSPTTQLVPAEQSTSSPAPSERSPSEPLSESDAESSQSLDPGEAAGGELGATGGTIALGVIALGLAAVGVGAALTRGAKRHVKERGA